MTDILIILLLIILNGFFSLAEVDESIFAGDVEF